MQEEKDLATQVEELAKQVANAGVNSQAGEAKTKEEAKPEEKESEKTAEEATNEEPDLKDKIQIGGGTLREEDVDLFLDAISSRDREEIKKYIQELGLEKAIKRVFRQKIKELAGRVKELEPYYTLKDYGNPTEIANQVYALRLLGEDPKTFVDAVFKLNEEVGNKLVEAVKERIGSLGAEANSKDRTQTTASTASDEDELIELGYLKPLDEYIEETGGTEEDYERYKERVLRRFGIGQQRENEEVKRLLAEIASLKEEIKSLRGGATEKSEQEVPATSGDMTLQQLQDSILSSTSALLQSSGGDERFQEIARDNIARDPDFRDAFISGDIARAVAIANKIIQKTKMATKPKVQSTSVSQSQTSPVSSKPTDVAIKDPDTFADYVWKVLSASYQK